MTKDEFIEVLKSKDYSYKIEGDKIVVTHFGDLYLVLKTIPPGVEFKNKGDVNFEGLETIPPGVRFENVGNVDLWQLKTIQKGVEFNNSGDVSFFLLKTIDHGVKFENGGSVNLDSLVDIPPGVNFENEGRIYLRRLGSREYVDLWDCDIEGTSTNRIFNLMIKRGIFI